MPIKIHDIEQTTPEWFKLREGLHTGSIAYKLLKFGTVDYPKDEPSNFKGNFYTRRGHTLEPEAIELYETINSVKVQRPGFITNTKFPTCGYSPDGGTEDRVIEIKAFGEKRHKEVAKNIPLEILAQCHFGMMIWEKNLCDLILYNPDIEPENALIIITLKKDIKIHNNFKRILNG